MSQKWLIVMTVLGGVVGCTAEPVDPPKEPDTSKKSSVSQKANDTVDPIDPFYLAIEAERWGVMIDNARGRETVISKISGDDDGRLRVHRALLNGIHNLILLREETFQAGLVSADTCSALVIPEWAFNFETEMPELETLQKRSDWLGEAIQPFISAACKMEDDSWALDCAVE